MKTLVIILFSLLSCSANATSWYVRSDGGTRYSADVPTGQCNGQANAAYGGTGVNQPCAFRDIRFLWSEGIYSPGTPPTWGWVIAGGDTVIVRDCIQYSAPSTPIPGSSGPCRIGYSGPNVNDYYLAVAGNPGASGMPAPPSGTSGAHTKILGSNYANCSSPSAKTFVHGGYGTGAVMSISGDSYVDFACFDITDYSACGRSGANNQCATNVPLDDYANNGLTSSRTSTNDTLTDINIHGLAANGMLGPTGDQFIVTRVSVSGNSSSGWNLDPNDGTTGTGVLAMSYFSSYWNGCNEEYPIVDALPYYSCSDDTSGGYGDGWGTATVASSPGWNVSCDHCLFAYNTQDGLDALHVSGTGSTVSATNSLFYGNMGNQVKIGGSASTLINNVMFGNCNALRQAIPGTPSGYNANLGDFCRAGDDIIAATLSDNYTATFEYNTVVGANSGAWLLPCASPCTAPVVIFRNNILEGFQNSTANGYPGGGSGVYTERIYFNSIPQGYGVFNNPGSVFAYNATYQEKDPCPNTNETHAICSPLGLANPNWFLYGTWAVNPASSSSSIVGSGIAVSGITTDFAGNNRKNPPTIGAYEYLGNTIPAVILSGNVVIGSGTFGK